MPHDEKFIGGEDRVSGVDQESDETVAERLAKLNASKTPRQAFCSMADAEERDEVLADRVGERLAAAEEKIREASGMRAMTEEEETFCRFQLGMTGHFFTLLVKAMFAADDHNLARMGCGFPGLVEVLMHYREVKGYWADLKDRWNRANPGRRID